MKRSLDELESDPESCHELLKEWLYFDAQNIVHRRVGRSTVSGVSHWNTNDPPSKFNESKTIYFFAGDYRLAEKNLAPIFTALAHCYRHNKQRAKLDALCKFLFEIKEHLDDHGVKFASGELRVEGTF